MRFKAVFFLSVSLFLAIGVGAVAQDTDEDIYSAVQRLISEGKDAKFVVRAAIDMGSNAYEVIRYCLKAGADLYDVVEEAMECGTPTDVIVQGAIDAGLEPSAVETAISKASEKINRAAESKSAVKGETDTAQADASGTIIYEPPVIGLPGWGDSESGLTISPSGF